jgi:hypothetical protein
VKCNARAKRESCIGVESRVRDRAPAVAPQTVVNTSSHAVDAGRAAYSCAAEHMDRKVALVTGRPQEMAAVMRFLGTDARDDGTGANISMREDAGR